MPLCVADGMTEGTGISVGIVVIVGLMAGAGLRVDVVNSVKVAVSTGVTEFGCIGVEVPVS